MIWLGVEPLVSGEPGARARARGRSRIPLVARFIARRAVDADALEPLVAAIGRMPPAETSLLEGMRDGLAGRFDLTAPPNWPPVLRAAEAIGRGGRAARRGRRAAVRRHREPRDGTWRSCAARQRADRRSGAARCRRSPPSAVRSSCRSFPGARRRSAAAIDAIRAIAAFDDEALGRLLDRAIPVVHAARRRRKPSRRSRRAAATGAC